MTDTDRSAVSNVKPKPGGSVFGKLRRLREVRDEVRREDCVQPPARLDGARFPLPSADGVPDGMVSLYLVHSGGAVLILYKVERSAFEAWRQGLADAGWDLDHGRGPGGPCARIRCAYGDGQQDKVDVWTMERNEFGPVLEGIQIHIPRSLLAAGLTCEMEEHEGMWACSGCGRVAQVFSKPSFCPNCGARAVGVR